MRGAEAAKVDYAELLREAGFTSDAVARGVALVETEKRIGSDVFSRVVWGA